ncbi:MAG: hypothetical protein IJB70_04260 [Clostridia bacterium]|nr:hypothetical protein [Clostridia bacterium]
MNRTVYIDLMERVLEAYSKEHIERYTKSVEENSIQEHGYPRLVANLGILIAHGRKTEYKDYFIKMMDLCCKEIPVAHEINGFHTGNDFSVKEVVFCILELEKAGVYDKCHTDRWRGELSKIDPQTTYSRIAPVPVEPVSNWAAFGAVSEQLRKFAGIGDESAFIDNQIASQLFAFDENGMYRDPGEPLVYDFVTRLQLAGCLYFGYEGKFKDALEQQFVKAIDCTLKMQSVTGEIPFGGRSNQFFHNEAFYAALCEFYVWLLNKRGETEKIGEFKKAASRAIDYTKSWLDSDAPAHIKNYYSVDSFYGCEQYAYFDKYMVTTASWLYFAYAMCDESVEETKSSSFQAKYVWNTSEHFHMTFVKFNDWFLQFDTNANTHYDGTGLGRIHKKGVPSQTVISVPFAKEPGYKTDIENQSCFSICSGVYEDGKWVHAFDEGVEYSFIEQSQTDEAICVKFKMKTPGGTEVTETYTVSDEGVSINASSEGNIKIMFPIIAFDGKNYGECELGDGFVSVSYLGHKCTYTTDGKINSKNLMYANRNAHYLAMSAKGEKCVNLKIRLS